MRCLVRLPRSFLLAASVIAVTASGTGCGDNDNACVKGDQKACACPGGAPDGVQVCLADGAWGECACGGTTTTGTAGTGGDTGGNDTGGTSTGGNDTGGNSTGGNNTGGNSTGGTTSSTTTTPMPCDNVFQGGFTIQNTLDVDTIAPYCEINGDLDIKGMTNGAGLASLSLPNLRKVDGKITMTGSVTTFSLPLLESARTLTVKADTVDLAALTTLEMLGTDYSSLTVNGPVSLPSLQSTGATGSLFSLQPHGDVSLPELTTTALFDIYGGYPCAASEKVQTPKLLTAQSFGVSCATSVDVSSATNLGAMTIMTQIDEAVSLSFPNLVSSRWFTVETKGSVSAPLLSGTTEGDLRLEHVASAALPKVKTIAADLWVYDLGMSTLSLPALETIGGYFKLGGSMTCFGNPPLDPNLVLTGFDLPKLTTLGVPGNANWIDLGPNPVLPQCRLDALTNQLEAHGWTGFVFNEQPNVCVLAAGPCP